MQTSMRVDRENRDLLSRIAREELGGATLDEALRTIIFEHQSRVALARLAAEPESAASYLQEGGELAEVDIRVVD